ncbi:hypothetical protein N7E70_012120 [Aminobacter sp. NyZ550]|jgi:hypothetical protein|uniref:DUF4189 domain-containing protein n=3 Tax=Aminobacter TaxID=31988 RepID=A0AAC9ARA3_AMIAI|nr:MULTISPECIES: hypothetical protein [Aminobacter]AMS41474.1 hypothetical protein AA2016_2549 [Aminobacter aminovorans]MBA8904459.1 hypothetical protein [Aminobacter ciceronei]MBA9018237.1 hypothetical protein [Aminobacter ciceronei]MBB3704178.1 hypothetical protein [Aminobacter aminovorans]WAX97546.1 hypothetical protein N7E70_012120 [Aminobacter sp. NyZ550]
MKLKTMRLALAPVLAGLLVAAVPVAAMAKDKGSLAGNEGKKRYAAQFGNTTGPCKDGYKKYVAAPGHSAYAQTHLGAVEAFYCGASLNAPSQAAAEKQALERCNSVGKKYKMKTTGNCAIYASK